MKKATILLLIALLSLSVSLNLFQYTTTEITCSKIDKRRKADILLKMWHSNLDWDKDGIPCENLPYKQEK